MARSGHKKIDEWKYLVDGVDWIVSVYMLRAPGDRGANTSAGFMVKQPQLEIELKHTDINELRKQTAELVKLRASVEWHKKLLVNFSHAVQTWKMVEEERDDDLNGNVAIEVEPIEVTTDAKGTAFYRRRSHNYGRAIEGEPETGIDIHADQWSRRRKSKTVSAMIDDTPENRAAIDAICIGFRLLGDKLVEILKPETIQHTLSNIKTLPLLPAPPAEPVKVKRRK